MKKSVLFAAMVLGTMFLQAQVNPEYQNIADKLLTSGNKLTIE